MCRIGVSRTSHHWRCHNAYSIMSKNAGFDALLFCPRNGAKPIGSLSVSGLSGVPRLANRCAMLIYIGNSCQAFALKFLIKYNVFLVLRRFIFQKCPKMAKNGVFCVVIYYRWNPLKTPYFNIILAMYYIYQIPHFDSKRLSPLWLIVWTSLIGTFLSWQIWPLKLNASKMGGVKEWWFEGG